MALELQYVEINVPYRMDEFSNFAQIRLNYKPANDTTMKVIFWRNPQKQKKHLVQCLIGSKDENGGGSNKLIVEGTDDPEGKSDYIYIIEFGVQLIEAMMLDEVETVGDLMNNVPLFCQSQKFKKILWEEIHQPAFVKTTSTIESPLKLPQGAILKEKSRPPAVIIEESIRDASYVMNSSSSSEGQHESELPDQTSKTEVEKEEGFENFTPKHKQDRNSTVKKPAIGRAMSLR